MSVKGYSVYMINKIIHDLINYLRGALSHLSVLKNFVWYCSKQNVNKLDPWGAFSQKPKFSFSLNFFFFIFLLLATKIVFHVFLWCRLSINWYKTSSSLEKSEPHRTSLRKYEFIYMFNSLSLSSLIRVEYSSIIQRKKKN